MPNAAIFDDFFRVEKGYVLSIVSSEKEDVEEKDEDEEEGELEEE